MGEIAEMMIDGTLCEGCGVYLDGESPGHPRYCSKTCADDRGATSDDDDDDYDAPASDESIDFHLMTALAALECAAEDLKKLKRHKKSKATLGILKLLQKFYETV